MADPVGPVFTGGFEEFMIQDEAEEWRALFFLPDRKNDALKRERKAPSATTFRKGCGSPLRGRKEEGAYG